MPSDVATWRRERAEVLALLSDALGEEITDPVIGVQSLIQQARTSERSLASHVARATVDARAARPEVGDAS